MILIFLSLLGKEPKKNHLMTVLDTIKYQWSTIGEQLCVNYGDLKSAEHRETHDDTRNLSAVLHCWIDGQTCEVSWRKIHSVVVDPPIKNKRVGDAICEFLVRQEIKNEYYPSNQPGKIKMIKIDKIIS